jgi:hypothetical protein
MGRGELGQLKAEVLLGDANLHVIPSDRGLHENGPTANETIFSVGL